jgi:hypothetical protein
MAGTLTISTLSDGTYTTSSTNLVRAPCMAWVNFNGSTAAIRASYNISSVTRSSTGLYTVNFTNAMTDANYAALGTCAGGANAGSAVSAFIGYAIYSTTAFDVQTGYNNGSSYVDGTIINVAIHR